MGARKYEFTPTVKAAAWALASGWCPMPGCGKPTVKFEEATGEFERLGDVAHIISASDDPYAPRHPDSLTESERAEYAALIDDRSGVINAIPLCTACHRIADRFSDSFDVDELHQAQQDERSRRFRRRDGWDPVQRRGLSRVILVDFADDREILEALLAAIAHDGQAEAFALYHDDGAALNELAGEVNGDLKEQGFATLTFLAKCAARLGEWAAAEQLWVGAARRAKGALAADVEGRAWAGAAAAANRLRRREDEEKYIERARKCAPDIPEVLAVALESPISLEDFASRLDPLDGHGDKWRSLASIYRCLTYLYWRRLDEARHEFDRVVQTALPAFTVRAVALNIAIEAARQSEMECRPPDVPRLRIAVADGLRLLPEMVATGRLTEVVRVRMLLAEGLGHLGRFDEGVEVLEAATPEESVRWEDRAVLIAAWTRAGKPIRARQLLARTHSLSAGEEAERELLLIESQTRADHLTSERARPLMERLQELIEQDSWVGQAAAAEMVLVGHRTNLDWSRDDVAAAVGEVRGNELALDRAKRVSAAAKRDADWRAELGELVHDPAALRMLMMNLDEYGAPHTAIRGPALALLEVDASPTGRLLAADALMTRELDTGHATAAFVAIGRDRNAAPALRAEAYHRAMRELRRTNDLPALAQLYTEEVKTLGREEPESAVLSVVNRWMPTVGTFRSGGSAKPGIAGETPQRP